ncbi:beta-ketoacyl-ACP synthase III [Priestia filamentosa]|uniref:beta-ketoacyl-ACP synthase III n=1 Tax=Priestia filamentosa TaxID=1402861 RepID=UPI003978E784
MTYLERDIKILGTGAYLPKNKVSSEEIDKKIGAKSGWSENKAGVKSRYFVTDETSSFMGAEAIKVAIQNANLSFEDIDCIVCGSGTMQQPIPSTASLIQEELGLQNSGIPAFDINSTCLSFITALDTISYAMVAGRYKNVIIVSSEISSTGLNWGQNESSILFGDGAVAVVVTHEPDSDSKLLSSHIETYSAGAHLSEIRGGGTMLHAKHYSEYNKEDYLFDMNGRAIFKLSSKLMPSFISTLFTGTNLTIKDMKLVIPHQASAPAMKLIQKKLDINAENFMTIFEEYGNMIAASIPLALHLAIEQNRISRGDKVLLLGTSAGLSIGGIIIDY